MAKRTIRRRARKNRTIRKVMRGCNRRRTKAGGAPPGQMEVHQYSGAPHAANESLAAMQQQTAQSKLTADSQSSVPAIPPPVKSNMAGGISTTPASAPAKGMQGGARTRHHRRRLRYKKSIARKSRRA
jgi:hypothetical protein